ncbi:hypothetical protein [Dietzia psychralcaliphila]|uniref:hypothetical protein n=1 Tax=Dietzia psychralcaliphila TaxID=139021 RepID=UPI001C1E3A64|nr:hypothetical protein [Dietzia psychralcaliphila]
MSAAGTPTPACRANPRRVEIRVEIRVVNPARSPAARRILVVRPVATRAARRNPVASGRLVRAGINPARSPSPSPATSGPGTRVEPIRAETPVVIRTATRTATPPARRGREPGHVTPAVSPSTRAIHDPPEGRPEPGTGRHEIAAPAGHPAGGGSGPCGSWVWSWS